MRTEIKPIKIKLNNKPYTKQLFRAASWYYARLGKGSLLLYGDNKFNEALTYYELAVEQPQSQALEIANYLLGQCLSYIPFKLPHYGCSEILKKKIEFFQKNVTQAKQKYNPRTEYLILMLLKDLPLEFDLEYEEIIGLYKGNRYQLFAISVIDMKSRNFEGLL